MKSSTEVQSLLPTSAPLTFIHLLCESHVPGQSEPKILPQGRCTIGIWWVVRGGTGEVELRMRRLHCRVQWQ